MSCLPSDALSHFEQREQELLALNAQLDQKRVNAVAQASDAVRNAESSSLHSRVLRKVEDSAADEAPASASSQLFTSESAEARPILAAAAAAVPVSRPSSSSATADGGDALHATIRFQNARIMALQEELDKTLAELSARDGEAQQLRQEAKQGSEELKRLQKTGASAEQTQEKLKKQATTVEAKCKDLEAERTVLQQEKDQLEVRVRKLETDTSSKDARLTRLQEDCDKYKASSKEAHHQDKDRAASDRRETERLTSEAGCRL
ncbi:unnamed protein product [Polarella glacialis]|uniref:Uncharacterized protein n=1 Tax=Polarella glacialis TaxID=89957 RepID=A0A813FW51_POLGL|nr:unnamed protein product [Polarella glacialis]CAE8618168.1 unnamed protein product [Polarella glacialis]